VHLVRYLADPAAAVVERDQARTCVPAWVLKKANSTRFGLAAAVRVAAVNRMPSQYLATMAKTLSSCVDPRWWSLQEAAAAERRPSRGVSAAVHRVGEARLTLVRR
jgi:hypothetical protein